MRNRPRVSDGVDGEVKILIGLCFHPVDLGIDTIPSSLFTILKLLNMRDSNAPYMVLFKCIGGASFRPGGGGGGAD